MAPSNTYTSPAVSYGSSHHLAPSADGPRDIREGTVVAEIRDLHAQLQALDDVTGKLRSRLCAVVVDRPTAAQCEAPKDPVQRCELAGQIHAAVDLACNITCKVNDMLCCLEL